MPDEQYLVGKCMEMCPLEEQEMRKKEELLHIFEIDRPMVKCYTRSAAGLKITNPLIVRPPVVLQETISYLFNNIVLIEGHKFPTIYDFINDRLKAIKQDLFVQQPSSEECIAILEPIVRFYAFSAYRLGNEERKNYDPNLNHNQLLETLKWLLREYSSLGDDIYVTETRIEMESLYLILNLGEPEALMRSLTLNKCLRQKLLQKCERISIDWYVNNFVKVFKLFDQLPILHSALLCAYQLPYIRRSALNVFNSAYSSKNLAVPISTLTKLLKYNNEKELSYDCNLVGVKIVNSKDNTASVHFNKTNWNSNTEIAPRFLHINKINERFKETFLPDLLLSNNNIMEEIN